MQNNYRKHKPRKDGNHGADVCQSRAGFQVAQRVTACAFANAPPALKLGLSLIAFLGIIVRALTALAVASGFGL